MHLYLEILNQKKIIFGYLRNKFKEVIKTKNSRGAKKTLACNWKNRVSYLWRSFQLIVESSHILNTVQINKTLMSAARD